MPIWELQLIQISWDRLTMLFDGFKCLISVFDETKLIQVRGSVQGWFFRCNFLNINRINRINVWAITVSLRSTDAKLEQPLGVARPSKKIRTKSFVGLSFKLSSNRFWEMPNWKIMAFKYSTLASLSGQIEKWPHLDLCREMYPGKCCRAMLSRQKLPCLNAP